MTDSSDGFVEDERITTECLEAIVKRWAFRVMERDADALNDGRNVRSRTSWVGDVRTPQTKTQECLRSLRLERDRSARACRSRKAWMVHAKHGREAFGQKQYAALTACGLIATDWECAVAWPWSDRIIERNFLALIDSRSIRLKKCGYLIDAGYRPLAVEIIGEGAPVVALWEIDPWTRVLMEVRSFDAAEAALEKTQESPAALKYEKGRSTRAQQSRKGCEASGIRSQPPVRHGQIVGCKVQKIDDVVFPGCDDASGDVGTIVCQEVSFSLKEVKWTAVSVWDLLFRTEVAK